MATGFRMAILYSVILFVFWIPLLKLGYGLEIGGVSNILQDMAKRNSSPIPYSGNMMTQQRTGN
jgi:1-acyl-sn-glycerol-3-phosphate acyltransferase